MNLKKPNKTFLKDQAYEKIKKLIVNGDLVPGEFLSEGFLSEQLEMSRTPIRSALQRLELDGILRIHPKQGIYICDISVKQINEVYEIRMALESFALRKLSKNIKKQQLVELHDILIKQYEYVKSEDTNLSLEYDMMFHLKLMEFIENEQMLEMFKSIRDKLKFYGNEVLKKKEIRLRQTYEEHLSILEELEKGNAEEVVQKIEEHLQNGRRTLLES
ncbi:GntR family transcriptional regulator [Pseudoneobacillus rhizosphaerae]|uniref:HTH-type transcriptional repressor RspR n=1 Tax=Pseudoneobacillus rhizosphaerae TaxID=2880968 RepID=A0A9C7GBR7_9BACI|nr:GntR family transcriptional regulator [Pseudoneobacillus rhizosphaerae]CAG9609418.1 HTH-type transcriptional repressor RspR [Pseudoneobacillus rhizosphaerae]